MQKRPAKAGNTEERSAQALAKPASDIGVATSEKLAASIVHEINQPLAAIVTNGDVCLRWLDREMPDLAKARSAAIQMISDANRAWEIVRRLRALSSKADPEYRPLNINDLVTETIPLLRREIARLGAALRLDLHSDVPPVAGDKVQLQQVVINLVVNGIQAMAGVHSPLGQGFILLQITTRPRTTQEKTAFYRDLCSELQVACIVAPTDVIVSFIENTDEDWSFGHGRVQFLTGELEGSKPSTKQ